MTNSNHSYFQLSPNPSLIVCPKFSKKCTLTLIGYAYHKSFDIFRELSQVSVVNRKNEEDKMKERFLEVSQEAGAAFFTQNILGEIVMLNLLRFRDMADYSANPELMPSEPIAGAEAYQKYIDYSLPFLEKSGGDIVFIGKGGKYLIGPQEEQWDLAMLIRHKSLSDFMAFATNQEYLAGLGHRTAALEDSRLLPLVESRAAT